MIKLIAALITPERQPQRSDRLRFVYCKAKERTMTIALPSIPHGTLRRLWWFLVAIPWRGLGLYSPQALLALPAAYASSQFAKHADVFPVPYNIMLGVAFEWVYLGVLAVAGASTDNHWYKIVNGVAVLTSIIYVTLHAAERYGLLANLTSNWWKLLFSLIHGVPLAGLNFVYGLLIHNHLQGVAEKEAAVAYKCPFCGIGFKSPAAVNGHQKGCLRKP